MKRRLVLLITLCMFVCSTIPIWAAETDADKTGEEPVRLVDDAELLDDDVEEELLDRLDDMAEDYKLDPVIVLVDNYITYIPQASIMPPVAAMDVLDYSPEEFATTYYQGGGFGSDSENSGIILLVSMAERDWHIYIQGEARVAVNDYGFDYISDRLIDKLGNDNYEEAIVDYVDDLELFFEAYDEGEPYGTDNRVKTPMKILQYFGIAVGVSAVLALVIVSFMKSQMNTAKPQPYAREYMKKGSFMLTNQQDLYLYSNTTRTARPKSSSSGGGGRSGSRGGSGGGGKF